MLKSTALEIIKSFSNEEIKKFGDFIRSPYFNMNSNIVRLFDLVKRFSPEYDNELLDKAVLWKELFPEKNYNYGTMKNLIFELKKLAAKFITIEELEKNKLEENEILVRASGKRNIPRFFISKVNEIEKKYETGNMQNLDIEDYDDYFTSMFRIKWMKYSYLRVYERKLAKEEDLHAYTALMAGSFLLITSLFYNNVLSQSLDINFRPENDAVFILADIFRKGKVDNILKTLKQYSPEAAKVINLYWLKLKVMMEGAIEEDFFEFRSEVYKNADILPVLDLKGFLFTVVNSANMLDSPKINVSKERIDSIKILMKKNMIAHDDGRIYVLELLPLFWSAGIINDFDVIDKLIKNYITKSDDVKKENVIKCGDILFRIRDGKYNDALELISLVIPESFMMKVHLRMLKVRCYYMTDDYESFMYERDSLNHFLKSSKSLSENNIRRLKDYFDKVNRMFRMKSNFKGSEFEKLKEEIFSDENYPLWMKEQLSIINHR